MIPEGLAGQLVRSGGEQASESGLLVPRGQAGFTARRDDAIDGGQQEVLADGQALLSLWQVAIDEGDQIQPRSQIEEGGDVTEGSNIDGLRLRGRRGRIEAAEEVIKGAEVSGFDDFGIAVDALAIADVVVGAAFDEFACEARHCGSSS